MATLAEKFRNWWNNPYWAPVTNPLGTIIGFGASAAGGFIDAIDDGISRNYDGAPALLQILKEMRDSDSFIVAATATIGSGIGGIAGAAAAGTLIASSGAGAVLIGLGALAAGAFAIVATPFVVGTAIALGGGAVGCVAAIPSFVKGCVEACKHYSQQKKQAAVIQAAPVLQTASADAQAAATRIFGQVQELPAELRGAVVKALGEKFAAGGTDASDGVMKAIEAMPEADRTALVTKIRQDLAPVFEAVATAQAQDAVTLQETAATMPALKFKRR